MAIRSQSRTLHIEKLDAALGARVEGLDLRESLSPERGATLRNALFEHQVLFFRGQEIDDDQHIAFARAFGEPNVYPVVEMLGSQKPLEFVEDGPGMKPKAENWHTDVTWLQDPPKMGVLSARVMPDEGGDTLWCSLYSIYDALPNELRERISDLEVGHQPGEKFIELVLESLGSDFIERFRVRYGDGSTHSLVRKHYVTGRPLVYLAGTFMDHVVDMDREEGRSLLRELMEIADHAVHQVRWKWEVDDLAIWDERSTMHRVDASHWPKQRLMRRCTIS